MPAKQHSTTAHLKVLAQFLGKTDGKDKLLATIQYACLMISAGEPGNAKKIQTSVAAGRKVFRILRPFEVLMPIINDPAFNTNKSLPPQVLAKLKCLCQFVYFGCDHWVWASQAGILTDKEKVKRFQRTSMWGWFGASICTVGGELYSIWEMLAAKPQPLPLTADGQPDRAARQAAAQAKQADLDRRTMVLMHAIIQALLALGLLEKLPVKPRTVGLLGVLASALNCYMLYPTYPPLSAPTAAADKSAAVLPSPGAVTPKLQLKTA